MWTSYFAWNFVTLTLTLLLFNSSLGKEKTHKAEKCDIRMWHIGVMENILIHSDNKRTPRQISVLKRIDRLVEMATDQTAFMPCSLLKTYSSLILPGVDIPSEEVLDDATDDHTQNGQIDLNLEARNTKRERETVASDIITNDSATNLLDSDATGGGNESISTNEAQKNGNEFEIFTQDTSEENRKEYENTIQNGDEKDQDTENSDPDPEEILVYSAEQIPQMDDTLTKSEDRRTLDSSTDEDKRSYDDSLAEDDDVNDSGVVEALKPRNSLDDKSDPTSPDRGLNFQIEAHDNHPRDNTDIEGDEKSDRKELFGSKPDENLKKMPEHFPISLKTFFTSTCDSHNRKSSNLICVYFDILAHKCNEWNIRRYFTISYNKTTSSVNARDCWTCRLAYPEQSILICHYISILNFRCGDISSMDNNTTFSRLCNNKPFEISSAENVDGINDSQNYERFNTKLMEHFYKTCAMSREILSEKNIQSKNLCQYMTFILPLNVAVDSEIRNNSDTIIFERSMNSFPNTICTKMDPVEIDNTEIHVSVANEKSNMPVPKSSLPSISNQDITDNNVKDSIATGMDYIARTESIQVPVPTLDNDGYDNGYDDTETAGDVDPIANAADSDKSSQTNGHINMEVKEDIASGQVTHDNSPDEESELSPDLSPKGKPKDNYNDIINDHITTILEIQESQHNAKLQNLELMIVKLENKLLSKSMDQKDNTHSLQKLENHILKIENELIKLNQTHQELQKEHETLKSKQKKISSFSLQANTTPRHSDYLALTDKSDNELVTQQKTKIKELSQRVHNQSRDVQELYSMYQKLEEQNRQLFQTMMNQTALISHVVSQLNEMNENNLKERFKTHELNLQIQLLQKQDMSRRHIEENDYENKILQHQDSRDSRSKSSDIQEQKSMLEINNHNRTTLFTRLLLILHPHACLESLLKIVKLQTRLNIPSPSICLYGRIIVSNIVPASLLTWLRCEVIMGTLALKNINVVPNPPSNEADITSVKSSIDEASTVANSHTSESNNDPVIFHFEDDEDSQGGDRNGANQKYSKDTGEETPKETSAKTLPLERSTNEDIIFFPIEDDEEDATDILPDMKHTHNIATSDENMTIDTNDEKKDKKDNVGPSSEDDETTSRTLNRKGDKNENNENNEEIKNESKERAFSQNDDNSFNDGGDDGDDDDAGDVYDGDEWDDDETRDDDSIYSEDKNIANESHKEQDKDGVDFKDTDRVSHNNDSTDDNDNKDIDEVEEEEEVYTFFDDDDRIYINQGKQRDREENKDMNKEEDEDKTTFQDDGNDEDGVNPDYGENDQDGEIDSSQSDDTNKAKYQGHGNENDEHHTKLNNDNGNKDPASSRHQVDEGNDHSHKKKEEQDVNKADLEIEHKGATNTEEKEDNSAGLKVSSVNKDNDRRSGGSKENELKSDPKEATKEADGVKVNEKKKSKQEAKQLREALQRPILYKAGKSDVRPADCFDLYKQGKAHDGLNKIFVQGLNSTVSVMCEMQDEGWTVLLKREDGAVDFYRDFKHYKEGFGVPTGEHYIGNEVIHYLTNQKRYALRVALTNWEGQSTFALYNHFWIDDEDKGFRLHLQGFSGTAGDGLGKHNGMKFSSHDVDNDLLKTEMGGSCAKRFQGAGWYYKCYMSNLMGVYYKTAVIPPKKFDGITWKPWLGPNYSMKTVVMSVRPLDDE